jgi:2,4-dienoyl-CoA reductase-like NADH-dependent reductase (Old Yellow Enzyme family)
MAIKDTRGGREFDKFVADGSGDTSLRVTTTTSVTTTADTSAGAVAVTAASDTADSAEKEIMAATDVEGKNRISIQLWNLGSTAATQDLIVRVWGSLKASPSTAPGTAWTQIGDDIDLNKSTSAYKAISTTPLKNIAVTCYLDDGSPLATTVDCYIMAD